VEVADDGVPLIVEVPMRRLPALVTERSVRVDEPIKNADEVPSDEESTERRACGEVVPIPKLLVVVLRKRFELPETAVPFAA
jgi:hypothetical protein